MDARSMMLAPHDLPVDLDRLDDVLPFLWEHAPLAMVIADLDGTLRRVNPALCTLLGYGEEELLGLRWQDLTHPDDRATSAELVTRLVAGDLPWYELDKRAIHREGHTVRLRVRVTLRRAPQGRTTGLLAVAQDVTAFVEAERRLAWATQRDELTGLPNRRCFLDEVERIVTTEPPVEAAVLFVDLDHFKTVNDGIGPLHGDRFLHLVAQRIRSCLGDGHLLARTGGDEFTVLLAGFGALATARAIAACIHRRMQAPMHLGDREIFCTASIGLASTSTAGHDADALVRDADIALNRAKEAGRACTIEFTPAMRHAVAERHTLRTDLQHATRRDELSLHYQPIVSLRGASVVGFEALMRWAHPLRGPVPPDVFLPIAEDHGVSPELGRWTVATACRDLSRIGGGEHGPYISINMSMRQLADPGLVAWFDRHLDRWEVPAHRLRVEVTEQVMAADLAIVVRTLHALRERGVGVYVDDFGTGVSSYARLHRLPLDALKIDRAFVWGMVEEDEGLALVRSILGLSSSLGLPAIAEGVETEQQRDLLLAMGCELGQGWLFGRPAALP